MKFSLYINRGKQTVHLKKKNDEPVQSGKAIDLGDMTINLEANSGEE